MASYTDKAPTFSPYVDQLPVEMMTKVGMAKQAQYQQGYEKIQQSIDKVAGLELYRDVDKGYMQSKLNELGTKLKGVAAGDFSNFQLTNSVAGMAGHIANDKIVQAGVNSTARIKSESARIKELEKKGLTDGNNDAYYANSLNAYLSNTELTDADGAPVTFNSSYVPYTNIIGKMKEALVNAGEDASIAEEIFVTGSDGKPLVVNGHLQYADAKTIEKLTSNKKAVLAAINTVFTQGDVKQQLQVDGWATYRGVPTDVLIAPLTESYQKVKATQNSYALELTSLLQATNLSPEKKKQLEDELAEVEKNKLQNEKSYISLIDAAQKNPEGFKQNFYEREYKQNIQDQFTKEKVENTYGKNDALDQQNYRQDYAFKERVQANTVAYQNASLDISRSNSALGWAKFDLDYPIDPLTGVRYKAPTGSAKKAPLDPKAVGFEGDISGDRVDASALMGAAVFELSTQKSQKAVDLYVDNIRQFNKNPKLSKALILSNAEKVAKSVGITTEQYLDRYASNIINKYDEQGLVPPPNLSNDYNEYIKLSETLNTKVNISSKLQKEAYEEAGVSKEMNKLNQRAGVNFRVNGEQFHLSPVEILGLRKYIKDVWQGSKAPAPETLSKAQLAVFTFRQNSTKSDVESLNNILKTYEVDDAAYNKVVQKGKDVYNKKLEKVVGIGTTTSYPINMTKPEIAKGVTDNLQAFLASADKKNIEGAENKEEIQLAMVDPTVKVSWKGLKPATQYQKWTGEVTIATKDHIYKLKNLDEDTLEKFSGEALGDYKETPVQDLLNINTDTKSTNSAHFVTDPDAWKTAHYKVGNHSNEIKKAGYSYRADVVSSNGGYRLVNYIKANGENNWTPIYGSAIAPTEDLIKRAFEETTPAEINAMYTNYLLQNKQ